MKQNRKIVGIVGGGQLGRMLTEAAHKLGFNVLVLDETPNSPASLVADEQIIGSYRDKEKVMLLGSKSDFVTFEIEGANEEALLELEKQGKIVNPSGKILKTIKDKFAQKVFLINHNIPVAQFKSVENIEDCERAGEEFGYPYMLKARLGAYDGRGNFVVHTKEEIRGAWSKLGDNQLYAEKFVPYVKELAVIVARDSFGKIITYPIVETVHKNNICHIVKSPAQIEKSVKEKGEHLAIRVLEALGGVGVFAIEMFLTKEGFVLVNEIAPRVHNSGHHTIEAFEMSQFEAQIRCITGMHLEDPRPTRKHAVMVNILGERDGEANTKEIKPLDGVHVHIYGKMQVRKERKMGHITVLGDNPEEIEKRALEVRKLIEI